MVRGEWSGRKESNLRLSPGSDGSAAELRPRSTSPYSLEFKKQLSRAAISAGEETCGHREDRRIRSAPTRCGCRSEGKMPDATSRPRPPVGRSHWALNVPSP